MSRTPRSRVETKFLTTLSLNITGGDKHKATFSTISTGRLKRRKRGFAKMRIRRCPGTADDKAPKTSEIVKWERVLAGHDGDSGDGGVLTSCLWDQPVVSNPISRANSGLGKLSG